MGKVKDAAKGAPPGMGGIVRAAMGKHAFREKGTNGRGKTVTGHGSGRKEANADYQRKGGRT